MTSTYDFYLFRPVEGADPEQVLRDVLASDQGLVLRKLLAATSPDVVREAALQTRRAGTRDLSGDAAAHADNVHLAEALRLRQPAWVLFADAPGAEGQGATGVLLRHPEGGLTIRIEREYVHVMLPYSHPDNRVRALLSELTFSMGLIEERRPFRTYDPQLRRFVRLPDDLEGILEHYAGSADTAMRPSVPKAKPKPWWRFW